MRRQEQEFRRNAHSEAISKLPEIVAETLTRSGLEARERKATLDRVPIEIRRKLPGVTIKALLAGTTPDVGFGLIGKAVGCGKTMAVAAIVSKYTQERIMDVIERDPYAARSVASLAWVSWPEMAERMKDSISAGDHEWPIRCANSLEDAELLVIDDIGAERMRGDYSSDYSAGKLFQIVNGRHRSLKPTIWTSNLDSTGLKALYGDAFESRLVSSNPIVALPDDLPDLRKV